MKDKKQEKNAIVEIVQLAMKQKSWKPVDLSRDSGVSEPVISRFLNGSKQIGVKNIQKILESLNLISTTPNFKALVVLRYLQYMDDDEIDEVIKALDKKEQEKEAALFQEFKEKRRKKIINDGP